MAVIHVADELQRVIERQVADGRAISATAFLEEAVMRLVDEAGVEEDELQRAVKAGSADLDAGRYTTVATSQEERRLHDGMMARLRARLAADG